MRGLCSARVQAAQAKVLPPKAQWLYGVDFKTRLWQGEDGTELRVPRCCGSACLRKSGNKSPATELFLHP